MKRILIILLLVFIVSAPVFSQPKTTGTIKGKLVDSTLQQNLKSATVSVLSRKDSSLVAYGLSNAEGSFQIENIPFGDYLLRISFLGFSGIEKTISVNAEKPIYDAGILYFNRDHKTLEEVIVKTPIVVINGDTTEFNSSQFKTIPNATAEDLLKKLPGVEVEKDGTVKAQGETISRVLVNGKRFFGNDPKMATRNIPAEVIEKVQVIDALSEQSEFSGFDDGNRVKTINIVTKKDRRKGIFGKASVAEGNEGRTSNAVSANRFNGEQQIAFIGQYNNINNQNFSIQDFLGSMNAGGGGRGGGGSGANVFSGNSSGISTAFAAGINYNDVWSKKTLANGSYFYNNVKSTNNRERFRETFITGDSSLFNTNEFNAENNNDNHRFHFEMDHRFDSMKSLLIRPNFSTQETGNFSETHSFTTKGKTSPLNEVRSTVNTRHEGYNFNNSILYRHQFKKKGRTFSLNFTQGFNTNERFVNNLSYSNSFSNGVDTLDQISSTIRKGKSFGANLSITERVNSKSQMELLYSYNYNKNNSDQQTHRMDTLTGKYSIVVPNLTNLFENTNVSQRVGLSYRVQPALAWNYSFGMAVQRAELKSNNFTKSSFLDQSFINLFPSFHIQYRKSRRMNMRFNYRGNTQQPGIAQLQDVIDNSNILHIRNGNPSLKQEFTNNFNFSYNSFNTVTFRNLTINLNGNFVSNKISNTNTINATHDSIVIDGYKIGPGVQFSKPQNLDGAFSLGGNINYNFPVKTPKSRISLTARLNYNRDVNLVNGARAYTNSYVLGGIARLTMNLQDKLDLNFNSNSTYNIVRYTSGAERNGDYFTQRFSLEPTYTSKNGWIIINDFDYVMNRGQSSGFNQSIPLWNAGIAKLFLKKKEAELRLTVFDLLNQNRSISRNIEQNYIEDVRTQVLDRYFLLSFTWHLKRFKGPVPAGRENLNERRREDRPNRNRN